MFKNSKMSALSVALLILTMFGIWSNPTEAVAQDARQSANGHGTLIVQNQQGESVRRQFSFNAMRRADGSSFGKAIVHNPAFTGNNGVRYKANIEVKCLNIIGNVAIISGTVRRTNDPIGSLAYFAVQDNGEPGSGSDAITNVFFFIQGGSQDPALVCQELTVEDFTQSSGGNLFQTIESGNIQVRGDTVSD